jgi:hypothetical protein
MAHSTADSASTPLLTTFVSLFGAYRGLVRQERVFVRLAHLSLGSVLTLGRQTISQMLVVLGVGSLDWSAWYRLFNAERLDLATIYRVLVRQVVAVVPEDASAIAVGVDGTQLPRSTRSFPGCGFTVSPRSPKWQRGLHFAQRYVGISALLPRSAQGDSRAIPLRWLLLRTAKTTPMGDVPERTEGQGALDLVGWLRERLDAEERAHQPLLVVADGAYSNAKVLAPLPERVVLFARCAKNRALFALPVYRATGRGRQPRYGERGPTPTETLHDETGWREYPLTVRGRTIPVVAKVSGPWLVRGAPFHPVLLVVVRGVDRGKGTTRRQRDPQFFLVSVHMHSEDEWALDVPLSECLAWAWQRWEVEVMHRELKSSFGVGQQQAFSDAGAATVIPWLVWLYALLVLTGYCTWGLGPGTVPDLGGWWHARRWSFARLWQGLRGEVWQAGDFQPVWARSADTWAEITTWLAAQTNATMGVRRL